MTYECGGGGRSGTPYEVALSLLARSDPGAGRPLVEETLRSGDGSRRECAAEPEEEIPALLRLYALRHADAFRASKGRKKRC